jgi:hypothetical protein
MSVVKSDVSDSESKHVSLRRTQNAGAVLC